MARTDARLNEEDKKNVVIQVYVTQKDREKLRQFARDLNMKMSNYMRDLALKKPLPKVE